MCKESLTLYKVDIITKIHLQYIFDLKTRM